MASRRWARRSSRGSCIAGQRTRVGDRPVVRLAVAVTSLVDPAAAAPPDRGARARRGPAGRGVLDDGGASGEAPERRRPELGAAADPRRWRGAGGGRPAPPAGRGGPRLRPAPPERAGGRRRLPRGPRGGLGHRPAAPQPPRRPARGRGARSSTLDGAELFDEAVLDAFVEAAVGALGDGTTETVTRRAAGASLAGPVGHRDGLPRGQPAHARAGHRRRATSRVVVERQLQALAAGAVGAAEPFTPLVPLPIDAAFVPVPTADVPADPAAGGGAAAGAARRCRVPPAVQGRYGVVAGERRTTVWAYTLDPATYPSAEILEPALAALVSARAGGAPVGDHRGARPGRPERRRPRGQPVGPRVPPRGPRPRRRRPGPRPARRRHHRLARLGCACMRPPGAGLRPSGASSCAPPGGCAALGALRARARSTPGRAR